MRRLPLEATQILPGGPRHQLRRVYTERDLIALGLGTTFGVGVMKYAGLADLLNAGPATIVSCAIAGVVILLCGLCFAELASLVPVAGGAFSYAYIAFGELCAWLVGWAVILELLATIGVLARGVSLYAVRVLTDLGASIPPGLSGGVGQDTGFDLVLLVTIVVLAGIVMTGDRVGIRIVWTLAIVRLLLTTAIVAVAVRHVDLANFTPFVPTPAPAPPSLGGPTLWQYASGEPASIYGIQGVLSAAAIGAFLFLGFDIIANAAEDVDRPRRAMPRAMLVTLATAVALYLTVTIITIGLVPRHQFDARAPVQQMFVAIGTGWVGRIEAWAGLLGSACVVLVCLIGATRVLFALARDRLLPQPLAELGSRFRTPTRATAVASAGAVLIGELVNVITLQKIVSLAALAVLATVAASVIALRVRQPGLERGFRVPGGIFTAGLAMVGALGLTLHLAARSWLYLGAWMAVGLLIYLAFGRRRSRPAAQVVAIGPAPAPIPPGRRPGRPIGWPLAPDHRRAEEHDDR